MKFIATLLNCTLVGYFSFKLIETGSHPLLTLLALFTTFLAGMWLAHFLWLRDNRPYRDLLNYTEDERKTLLKDPAIRRRYEDGRSYKEF